MLVWIVAKKCVWPETWQTYFQSYEIFMTIFRHRWSHFETERKYNKRKENFCNRNHRKMYDFRLKKNEWFQVKKKCYVLYFISCGLEIGIKREVSVWLTSFVTCGHTRKLRQLSPNRSHENVQPLPNHLDPYHGHGSILLRLCGRGRSNHSILINACWWRRWWRVNNGKTEGLKPILWCPQQRNGTLGVNLVHSLVLSIDLVLSIVYGHKYETWCMVNIGNE